LCAQLLVVTDERPVRTSSGNRKSQPKPYGMRILIATDAFPPVCGGSGWSTYELAKGLRAKGHDILVVRPRFGPISNGRGDRRGRPGPGLSPSSDEYDGFRPVEFHSWAPPVPFVRNYFKNERLYASFEAFLEDLVRRHSIDLLHAQHLLTGPPGIAAARAAGVPSVCTIRDYWPLCYWSNLIRNPNDEQLCPACSARRMMQCLRPRAGALWPIALSAIPYMRSNLARKRVALSSADVVVAVSTAMAHDLRARAPEMRSSRIEMIPNPVDVAGIRAQADRAPRPMPEPYAIYVGKLEPNKGAGKLPVALDRAQLDWPLVVIGDGSERQRLEEYARASGRDIRFLGWRPREDALGWLRHAELLVFPSHGPESLSRVLLEASALGVPIAAMNTGGTADIVLPEQTGLLSTSAQDLGDDLARLRRDPALRAQLGGAARRRVEDAFDAPAVIARLERLYLELVASAGRRS
jgi:glycogen synthase